MEFRERLRELRLERSLSQKELASELCMSKMAVCHWELGDSEPSIAQLVFLADFFDVSLDYLMGREENPTKIG